MQFTSNNIYTWTNLDKKIWEGILLEKRNHWLQFAIFAEDMRTLDGYMMVNTEKVQHFSLLPARAIEPMNPEKSLEKTSFQDTMRDGILCEIVGEIDGLLEDE